MQRELLPGGRVMVTALTRSQRSESDHLAMLGLGETPDRDAERSSLDGAASQDLHALATTVLDSTSIEPVFDAGLTCSSPARNAVVG
jgi:hypothetical protein